MQKVLILFLFPIISSTFAIDLNTFYEGDRLTPPTVYVDPKLFEEADTAWFLSYGSKYELLRNVMVVLNKTAEEVTENDLKANCIYVKFDSNLGIYSNEHFVNANMTETRNGELYWELFPDSEEPVIGTSYTIMTDNKSYMVYINYWDNKNISWSVYSAKKSLDQVIKSLVLKQVKSFGFNQEMAYELNPKSCIL